MLATRWEDVFLYTRETTRRDGDVFPSYCQFSRPTWRRRQNLALGVHVSAASSRGRVGLASLRWRSRRRRRSLENAQLRARFLEQRQVGRVFHAGVHRRQRLHELPGDGARQQHCYRNGNTSKRRRHIFWSGSRISSSRMRRQKICWACSSPYSMSPHVNRTEGALGSSSCRRRRGREWMDIGEKDKDVPGQRLAAVERRRQVVHAVGVVDELSRQTHDQLVAALHRQLM